MALPQDLVLIRHAESEGNIAQIKSRGGGDHSAYTETFRARHSSGYRLTPQGVMQAQAAGTWLKAAGLASFDQAYVSEFIRAIETAGHLGLKDTHWITTDALRERDTGLMDALPENERQTRFPTHVQLAKLSPYFWSPPEGESFAQVNTRVRAGFLPLLEQAQRPQRACAVSHGHTIRILRAIFEHMPFWEYEKRERAGCPEHVVENAHIFHYTRVDPENSTNVSDDFGWVRSVCPWDLHRTDPRWRKIERPTYQSQDLIAIAERFPRLLA